MKRIVSIRRKDLIVMVISFILNEIQIYKLDNSYFHFLLITLHKIGGMNVHMVAFYLSTSILYILHNLHHLPL